MPTTSVVTQLARHDESDHHEVDALTDQVKRRIDAPQRERVEDKPSDEEEDVAVAKKQTAGFGKIHTLGEGYVIPEGRTRYAPGPSALAGSFLLLSLAALSWRELGHSQRMDGVRQVLDVCHWRLADRVIYEMNSNISTTSGMHAF